MSSITTIMPDTGTAVDEMTLAELEAELRRYTPGTQAEVVELEEHRARRQALWRRLDQLVGVWRPAIARPVTG